MDGADISAEAGQGIETADGQAVALILTASPLTTSRRRAGGPPPVQEEECNRTAR